MIHGNFGVSIGGGLDMDDADNSGGYSGRSFICQHRNRKTDQEDIVCFESMSWKIDQRSA